MNNQQKSETTPHQIARQLLAEGRYRETKTSLVELLQRNSKDYLAIHMLGLLAEKSNQRDLAVSFFSRAIEVNRDHFPSYIERGKVRRQLANYTGSVLDFSAALKIQPLSFEALNNRGIALYQAGESSQAIQDFDAAIAIKSDCSQAHFNRGLAHKLLGHTSAALDDYARSIELDANNFRSYNNRAMLFRDMKKFEKAINDLDKCLSIRPDFAEAMWNKALTLLLMGKYDVGWKLYESRWSTKEFRSKVRTFSSPLWLGKDPLKNKAILIHSEQGLGDSLQFCRYINLFKNLECTVLLEVEKPLLSIMLSLLPKESIFEKGSSLPKFDYHCPMMSLPLAFKTAGITYTQADPYLWPDMSAVSYWSEVLGNKKKPLVGISWRGNPDHVKNSIRSIELRRLIPLLSPRLDWISLEINPSEDEVDLMDEWEHITNFGEKIGDFSSTAALCQNLHAVVSVDTSIAHLAGSIGTFVHLLLPFVPDFRWQHSGISTHWYPNMKLHRQNDDRKWEPVIRNVNEELTTH